MSFERNLAICMKVVKGLGRSALYILDKFFDGLIDNFFVEYTEGAMV
jgi:hypothetical protein